MILLGPILKRGLWHIKVWSICGHLKKKLGLFSSVSIIFKLSQFSFRNRTKLEFPSSTRELILSWTQDFQEVIKSAPVGLET